MCMKTEIWLEQMLRDMNIDKYLEVNLLLWCWCLSFSHYTNSPL